VAAVATNTQQEFRDAYDGHREVVHSKGFGSITPENGAEYVVSIAR
jgi:hypothetical protein